MNWNSFKLVVLLPLVIAAGCGKEIPDQVGNDLENVMNDGGQLNVFLPGTETKTVLGEKTGTKYPTLWKEGDCLSLNGYSSLPLSAADAGRSSAPFTFRDGLASPFNLLYPAGSGADVVKFPYRQTYTDGSFDPSAAPMWGSSLEYKDVSLNHLSSLLRMGLTSSEELAVTEISITAPGGEGLSGTFTLGKNPDGTFDGSLSGKSTSSTVTMIFGQGGERLSATPLRAYIAIPAGAYSRGLRATVKTAQGKVMILSMFSEGCTVAPSKVLEFPDIEFEAGSGEVLYISNATEFAALAANSNAVLVSDIDMSGRKWTPLSFSGTLDGRGHTVKGLSDSFASTLSGTVKDVNIASVLTNNSEKSITWGALACTLAASGVVEGCVFSGTLTISYTEPAASSSFAGGLIGTAAAGSQMRDCVNTGTVQAVNVSASTLTMGGTVGRMQSSAENLVNRGTVLYDATSKLKTLYIGGAIGNHNSSGALTAIGNEGTVIVKGSVTAECYMGGITGANSSGVLENIVTSPDARIIVDCTEKSAVKPHVGGIVGHLTLQGAMKGCKNYTPITFITKGEVHNFLSIGGLVGYYNRNDSSNTMVVSLEGCENHADITVSGKLVGKSGAVTEQSSLGGVIGYAYLAGSNPHTFSITGCDNYGNIILEDVTYAALGGVIGGTNWAASTISGCTNRGNISVSGEGNTVTVGGVVASVVEGNTLTKCKNAGDVWMGGLISGTNPGTVAASYCGVGGRVWNGEAWKAPLESDFAKYMYQGWAPSDYASHPEYFVGCSYWDGKSKLSWED